MMLPPVQTNIMKKIVRNFTVEKDLDWNYGIKIEKLRAELDRLEKLGATDIEIEPTESYGSMYVEITAYANRMETDEECKERTGKEQARKDDIARRELEQLRKLQEKYKKQYWR